MARTTVKKKPGDMKRINNLASDSFHVHMGHPSEVEKDISFRDGGNNIVPISNSDIERNRNIKSTYKCKKTSSTSVSIVIVPKKGKDEEDENNSLPDEGNGI